MSKDTISERILDAIVDKWDVDKFIPKEGTFAYRIVQILTVLAIIVGVIGYCVVKMIMCMIWFIVACVDIALFIPFGLLWIFIGEFYGMKMSLYVGEKFKVIEVNK